MGVFIKIIVKVFQVRYPTLQLIYPLSLIYVKASTFEKALQTKSVTVLLLNLFGILATVRKEQNSENSEKSIFLRLCPYGIFLHFIYFIILTIGEYLA